MMMLVFVSLRFGLRAWGPQRTAFSHSLSSSYAPVPSLVFLLLLGVQLSKSIPLYLSNIVIIIIIIIIPVLLPACSLAKLQKRKQVPQWNRLQGHTSQ